MAGHREMRRRSRGDPGTPPTPAGKASSRAVTDNFSIFRMLHHNPSFDPLEAAQPLAYSRFAGVCRVSIFEKSMYKGSAACESLEASPLLGCSRSAGLSCLYIGAAGAGTYPESR